MNTTCSLLWLTSCTSTEEHRGPVAMIVRNLLSRLGLEPDSDQLRCLATSASLTADAQGLAFLEQYFGVDRSSFYVTAGEPRTITADLPISREQVLSWNSQPKQVEPRP